MRPYPYHDEKGRWGSGRAGPRVCRSARHGAVNRPGPQECAALRNLQLPGVALSEISAEWIPAGPAPRPFAPPPATNALPAYCRLAGTLNRRQGADGQSYGIGFALALPATWNGRFLFQGGGGFNGVLGPPYGASAAGGTPALARGFAVVSTDSGHSAPGGNALDTAFLRDQQATMDFAYQAVERVTTVAKAIIARHYAQPVSRSYYAGCSTGGREAMLAAQRYPLEFDGVIAGAPNMRINYAVLGLDWVNVQLNQVAPRGHQRSTSDAGGAVQHAEAGRDRGDPQRLRCERRLARRAGVQHERLQVRPRKRSSVAARTAAPAA